MADVGCGNGKMADAACPTRRIEVDSSRRRRRRASFAIDTILASRRARVRHAGRRGACAVACDTSDALIDRAHKHTKISGECLVADGVRLPYRSAFDVALNIAVLHHPSRLNDAWCIRETLRILKPGGRALFYAWAKGKNGPRGVAAVEAHGWSRFICASTGPTTTRTLQDRPAALRDEEERHSFGATATCLRRANCGGWSRRRRASTSAITTRGTGPWLVLNYDVVLLLPLPHKK